MSTKKPIIQVIIEDETLVKYKALCDKNNRSISNQTKTLILDFIANYENNDTIKFPNQMRPFA